MLIPSRITVPARRQARVEIIPLIDVIFFLLATFVLFTLSLSVIRSLPVVLPFPGDAKDRPEIVTIQVSGGGAGYWNGDLIDLAEVPGRLEHYKARTEIPRVLITGDGQARFGATVKVLDEVRAAGIANVSLETRPRSAGR